MIKFISRKVRVSLNGHTALYASAAPLLQGRVSPLLLALPAVLFLAAPVNAQIQWRGTVSDDWYTPGNWSSGTVPGNTSVEIDTITPNATVINGGAAFFGGMNIGIGATGSLEIKNGATLIGATTGGLVAGRDAGAAGTVSVDGAGSLLALGTSPTFIGFLGSGTLTVTGGGRVTSQQSIHMGAAQSGGGTGIATIRDAGSQMTASQFYVGNGGLGFLNIENGGVATAGQVMVAYSGKNTRGAVVVRDFGSRLASLSLLIGGAGQGGMLDIANGGVVTASQTSWAGYSANVPGVITVHDAGSELNIGPLILGRAGLGTLNIHDGGAVTSTGPITIAQMAGATGTLNIGAAPGEPAGILGSLNATAIQFGAGAGAINFNHVATDYVFDATIANGISGNGTMTAIAGRTIFENDHLGFSGTLEASTGIFQVNGDISNGVVSILAGGTLEGIGRVGNTVNAGIISPGNSIGTLTIAGNYTGVADSSIWIETVLGDDASQTDRLVITGDASGSSSVRVTNLGGSGALTVEGIKIIDVGGLSNAAFTLAGDFTTADGQRAVIGGAYAYTLHQNGVSTPDDGDWYLRSVMLPAPPDVPASPRYQPGVPLYESYPQVLIELNGVSTLQQRVGNRYWSGQGNAPQADKSTVDGRGMWGRIEGSHGSFGSEHSTSDSSYRVDFWKVQTGLDLVLNETIDGSVLVGSLIVHYGQAAADVKSVFGRGSIDSTGYGVGAALTWYGANGFYVDGQAHHSWYDSELKSKTTGRNLSNDGTGYALSVETGKRFALGNGLSLTPQVQLIYSNVDFDGFTDAFGAKVRLDRGDSLRARVGLSLDKETTWVASNGTRSRVHLFAVANLYNEFLEGARVDVSGTRFARGDEGLWGGVGLGASYNWNNDLYSVYGKVNVSSSLEQFADSNVVSGSLGFRVKW